MSLMVEGESGMTIDDGVHRRTRGQTFTSPWPNVFWSLLFLAGISFLAFLLYQNNAEVRDQIAANLFINLFIGLVLAFGCLYAINQIIGVVGAARWLTRFQTASVYDDLSRPPAAIAPMAELLSQTPGDLRLPAGVARAMLDSVGSRMSDAGEITRYLARLLIFLGLLGTFWGLLLTLGGVVAIVTELANATGPGGGENSINALFAAMEEPLQGMGTAFSTSIFGIAGSLILGFLDLQATQANNRFFNEVEDWLAKISRIGSLPEGGGAGSAAYSSAVLEQMAEGLDDLVRMLRKGEESRVRTNEAVTFLSTELAALNDRLARQEEALIAIKDRATDTTLQHHLRNVDATLSRFAQDMTADRDAGFRELRTELRTLANTIAQLIERRERG